MVFGSFLLVANATSKEISQMGSTIAVLYTRQS